MSNKKLRQGYLMLSFLDLEEIKVIAHNDFDEDDAKESHSNFLAYHQIRPQNVFAKYLVDIKKRQYTQLKMNYPPQEFWESFKESFKDNGLNFTEFKSVKE